MSGADESKTRIAESREFGRRVLEAWQAMSHDEQVAFILDLPYGMILQLAAINREASND